MRLKPSSKPRSEPDLIPMINVVFLMLIFFLVAATLRPFSMNGVTPPRMAPDTVSGKSPPVRQLPLRIFFTSNHQIRLGKRNLTLEELAHHLGRQQPALPDDKSGIATTTGITLIADRKLPATALLPLLDRLKSLGFQSIRLVTEQKK